MIFASMENVDIDRLSIDLEGDIDTDGFLGIDSEVRNGFQEIRYKVTTSAADQHAARAVIERAEAQCSVSDCIRNEVPIVCEGIALN